MEGLNGVNPELVDASVATQSSSSVSFSEVFNIRESTGSPAQPETDRGQPTIETKPSMEGNDVVNNINDFNGGNADPFVGSASVIVVESAMISVPRLGRLEDWLMGRPLLRWCAIRMDWWIRWVYQLVIALLFSLNPGWQPLTAFVSEVPLLPALSQPIGLIITKHHQINSQPSSSSEEETSSSQQQSFFQQQSSTGLSNFESPITKILPLSSSTDGSLHTPVIAPADEEIFEPDFATSSNLSNNPSAFNVSNTERRSASSAIVEETSPNVIQPEDLEKIEKTDEDE